MPSDRSRTHPLDQVGAAGARASTITNDQLIGRFQHTPIPHISIERQIIVDENPTDVFQLLAPTDISGEEQVDGRQKNARGSSLHSGQ